MKTDKESFLKTKVLPKYNCSNCKYFICIDNQIKDFGKVSTGLYAKECGNLVHPLQDCILRGFKGHSEQPGFSQTLNKTKNPPE